MEQQGQGVVSGEASKRHLIVPFSRAGEERGVLTEAGSRAAKCTSEKVK